MRYTVWRRSDAPKAALLVTTQAKNEKHVSVQLRIGILQTRTIVVHSPV
jgi:hypothetical protein